MFNPFSEIADDDPSDAVLVEQAKNGDRAALEKLILRHQVAAYFTADKANSEAVSRCFADDGVVKDEGHTYNGRAAIKKWKEDASAKYEYTSKPLVFEQRDGKIVVTCRLTGNFPGSPVDLRFIFELAGEKIASLEIVP